MIFISTRTISIILCYTKLKKGDKKMKTGFTLIELLVVVLIIGILSAVALPQYQKAVYKAKMANAVQVAVAIRKAEEIYYMANGTYLPNTLDGLDVDFSLEREGEFLHTPEAFFDIMQGPVPRIDTWFCPGSPTYNHCLQNRIAGIYVWFAESEKPNEIVCQGFTPLGQQLCKSVRF